MSVSPRPEDDYHERIKRLSVALSDIKRQPVEVSADPQTQDEALDLERQHRLALLSGIKQDIEQRKAYASRFFVLSCAWIAIITAFVLMDGLSAWSFKISDAVILALIGSTTVNILGVLYVVANYLFPKK
jgi:hypothetical protein